MINRNKWEYFQKKLELTWNMYLEFLGKIDQESLKIRKAISVSTNEKDQKEYLEYLSEIDVHYRKTLYESMLITFCSLAEHFITEITKEMVSGYESKIKKEKGDWLVRNLELIKKAREKLDINENDKKLFSCYIKIRNCLVHNGGIITNSKNPKELKTAIDEILRYGKRGNYILLKVTKDNHLLLGCDIVGEVVILSEEILEKILELV